MYSIICYTMYMEGRLIVMTIWFDMDGTIANLYGVNNWLEMLLNSDTTPYAIAKPMMRMSALAKRLNNLQKKGYKLGIISWTSKSGTTEYNQAVEQVKKDWLRKHLPTVTFDTIKVVAYGTNKGTTCKEGILFDDEELNRKTWVNGNAFHPDYITNILQNLSKKPLTQYA